MAETPNAQSLPPDSLRCLCHPEEGGARRRFSLVRLWVGIGDPSLRSGWQERTRVV